MDTMYISSKDLAQILGVTPRRVPQLVTERVIDRDEKSRKYFLPDCVQKYFKYKYASDNSGDANYDREHALHERAKRERAELILAQMKGELHAANDVEMIITDMIVNTKTRIRGIPVKLAPALLAQDELAVIENIISNAIDECLIELADYNPALFTDAGLYMQDGVDENDE
jgi:phage terminase Nu1 subunit (DNA packaging protein)